MPFVNDLTDQRNNTKVFELKKNNFEYKDQISKTNSKDQNILTFSEPA